MYLVKDPLCYIATKYMNTTEKLSLKGANDMFNNITLNSTDSTYLYKTLTRHKRRVRQCNSQRKQLKKCDNLLYKYEQLLLMNNRLLQLIKEKDTLINIYKNKPKVIYV